MSDWQPIETAPKQGKFLVFMSDGEMHTAKPVGQSRTLVIGGAFSFDRSEKPTHWMPLPEPPETDTESAQLARKTNAAS